jgi:hypothetical protein
MPKIRTAIQWPLCCSSMHWPWGCFKLFQLIIFSEFCRANCPNFLLDFYGLFRKSKRLDLLPNFRFSLVLALRQMGQEEEAIQYVRNVIYTIEFRIKYVGIVYIGIFQFFFFFSSSKRHMCISPLCFAKFSTICNFKRTRLWIGTTIWTRWPPIGEF